MWGVVGGPCVSIGTACPTNTKGNGEYGKTMALGYNLRVRPKGGARKHLPVLVILDFLPIVACFER